MIKCLANQGFSLAILVFASRSGIASGWTDFELDVDDGYRIIRANDLDVGLWGESNSNSIYHPRDQPDTGPVSHFYVTGSHIFLKTWGRSPRNLFEGDTFEDVDQSREFFFVYDKVSDNLSRPLSQDEFVRHDAVIDEEAFHWTSVKNPNVLVPLIGLFLFALHLVGPVGLLLVLLILAVGTLLVLRFYARQADTVD